MDASDVTQLWRKIAAKLEVHSPALVQGTLQVELSNGSWLVSLRDKCTVEEYSGLKDSGAVDTVIHMSEQQFLDVFSGKENAQRLYVTGQLVVTGNPLLSIYFFEQALPEFS